MTTPRQIACTPITHTLTRTQCASHTEVVHVVSCGVEEIGEESSSTSSKSKVANSCLTHHVLHRLTLIKYVCSNKVGCVGVQRDTVPKQHPSCSVSFDFCLSVQLAEMAITVRSVPRSTVGRSLPLSRSEEQTSELQSLMRISYAVFCLQKKKQHNQ